MNGHKVNVKAVWMWYEKSFSWDFRNALKKPTEETEKIQTNSYLKRKTSLI